MFTGNGEIDFQEFLNLMTNTERFLEGFGEPIKSSRIFPESIYSLDIWL